MSEKMLGIDLNSDVVSMESIDRSANETLMEEEHIDSGQVTGPSFVESRVLGDIDSEKGENGSVGCGITENTDGFDWEENKVDSVFPGGENEHEVVRMLSDDVRVKDSRDEGNVSNGFMIDYNGDVLLMGSEKVNEVSPVPETFSGEVRVEASRVNSVEVEESEVMGVFTNVGYKAMMIDNDGYVSELGIDHLEKKSDSVLMGGEKVNESVEELETCLGDVSVEGLRGEMDEIEGKVTSERGNVMGALVPAGNGATITNDGVISRLKVDESENKVDDVLMGGEKVNEVAQVPETRSGYVPLEGLRSDESNAMGVSVHAGKGSRINLVVDLNSRHGSKEEMSPGNAIVNKGTKVKEVSGESNVTLLDGRVANGVSGNKEVKSNENGDEVVKEQRSDARLEYADGNDRNSIALRPKIRGEECQTEKHGEYYLSDIVWAKVRSHCWWPGQIFEPSAASVKALKHFKKESYLVAYFGDQTFAWNEATTIKPFHMNFNRMEKQSNSVAFRHAMDCALAEVSRRVMFGLSCSCIPEKHHAKIRSQILVNAGIREESSKRDGGDAILSAITFLPTEVFQHLKVLAVAPHSGIGRLRFATTRAQFLVFNQWKGRDHLSEVGELDGLSEKDPDEVMDQKVQSVKADGEVSSEIIESGVQESSSRKRKHGSGNDEGLKKKAKRVTGMMSGNETVVQNGEKRRRGRKKGSLSSDKKCEVAEAVSGDSKLGKRKRSLLLTPQKESVSPKKFENVGERIFRGIRQVGGFGVSSHISTKSERKKLIPANIPPPKEMLSKLCLAALYPMECYRSVYPLINVFSDFRNSICLQNTNAYNHEHATEEYKGGEASETMGNFEFDGIEDSYWTDRIIQSNTGEPQLFELKIVPEETKTTSVGELGIVVNASPKSDAGDGADQTVLVGDSCDQDSSTTLSLKFSDLKSTPSVTDLNKIFSQYGPLDESQTKVSHKGNRVNIVFKKRADAETAFSSAGKFSIFGPSLLSYRLKPTPRKAPTVSKQIGKSSKSAKGKLQFEV